jgi:hypothetical protein
MTDWLEQLSHAGYTLLPAVLTPAEVEAARLACASVLAGPDAAPSVLVRGDAPPLGARNLLRLWPGATALARRPALADPLLRVLGPRGGLVRGLYFDKPPGSDWALPWHRDQTIAVRRHGPPGRFTKPTRKAGVPHVEAPPEILASMVTSRLHLDPMHDANGPLRVMPGSHTSSGAAGPATPDVTLRCQAGDVLLMRPLLLHASVHCVPDYRGHRRVVHLEFAPSPDLPDGYEWDTFLPLHNFSHG